MKLEVKTPYDWQFVARFLRDRAAPGVEVVRDDAYFRTVCIGPSRGFVRLSFGPAPTVDLEGEISSSAKQEITERLRRLFDLDADPARIAEHLAVSQSLAKHVAARPGIRVPGAFDAFEAATRAVLGQQVSVAAATTLYGRLIATLGEPIKTPFSELSRLSPKAEDVADASEESLTKLGILRSRAATLRTLAREIASGALSLAPTNKPEETIERLCALPGIGKWTAHYIAMRALSWSDAFPAEDLGIRKALGGISARDARSTTEPWRPFRAYAVMHLWASLAVKVD